MFYQKLSELQKKKILKNLNQKSKEKTLLTTLKLDHQQSSKEKTEDEMLADKGFGLEPIKHGVDKLLNNYLTNCPEQKLSHKIEYAKDYLDRDLISEDYEPDIIKIDVYDKTDILTCVEITQSAKVLLLGQVNGAIQAYYLFEKTIQNENEKEDLEKFEEEGEDEKNDGDKNEDLKEEEEEQKPAKDEKDNLEQYLEAKALDFKLDLRKAEFLGHKSVITCLSINYDSTAFVSGCADGTIR